MLAHSALNTTEDVTAHLGVFTDPNPKYLPLLETILRSTAETLEARLDRRFMYRGSGVEDATPVVNDVTLANGPLAFSPLAGNRSLRYRISGLDAASAGGTVTVTGTDPETGASKTEVIDLREADVYGIRLFATITSVVVANLAGGASGKLTVLGAVPYVENWTFREKRSEAYTLQRPVVDLLLHEDPLRAYGAETMLKREQDYLLTAVSGRLVKVKGDVAVDFPEDYYLRFPGTAPSWKHGHRVLHAAYTAGYAADRKRSRVNPVLKSVNARHAVLVFRELEREHQGITSISDDAGNVTRYSQAKLTSEMLEEVKGEYAHSGLYSPEPEYL